MATRLAHDFESDVVIQLNFVEPPPLRTASGTAEEGSSERGGFDLRWWNIVCWIVSSDTLSICFD